MIPFIKKYNPSKPEDIVGQDSAFNQVDDFISKYSDQPKKSCFLWGPSGTGKTSSVHVAAKKQDLELIEINASDFRNKDQINERLGNAIFQRSLFSSGKVILMDEVDGLSGMKDRGAIQAIIKLIDKTTFPIFLTASNPYDQKFSTLRRRATLVEFTTLDYLSIFQRLKLIATEEKIKAEDDTLKTLARRCGGDLRAAINDFQTLSKGKELTPKSLESLHDRLKNENMIQALLKVFKTTDPAIALTAYDQVLEDQDKIFLWLDENIPKEYTKPEDLANAYNALSRADVFKGRIRRWQHWRFMVYINQLLSAGIALSKKEKYTTFTKYAPTMKLLKIWQANMKYAKRKAIAQKIAHHTHTSSRIVLDSTLPFFQEAFKKNNDFAASMTKTLKLDLDEVKWLMK
ncbi:MAG: replication factor C large subunit [Candidatus Woesearchaeota archaeon]|jgi:replication factor C large subunit|nr:replication factor C large subunit [Candidatus Woesearchaeota archaeon]MDP7323620.1 replication factor C large subunit [Candidatus Woesearchaeota archaeon]MDP7458524.1 replication factor C large subunit [Candidatus Woesearchaeota archaeon]